MKLRLIFVLVMILCMNSIVFSGELTISTENAKIGDEVLVIYTDDGNFTNEKGIYSYIYFFSANDPMPLAYEVWMNFDDSLKIFKGSFTVPKTMIFGLIKIGNEKYIDNNSGNFWEIIIYDDSNIPLEGAKFRMAVSYLGTMPENYRRQANFIKALDCLENEVKNHPKNIGAKIGMVTLKYDLKTISKGDFESKLKGLISESTFNYNESALTAVARALRTLNRNAKAKELEEDFIKRNPKSMLAQEAYTEKLSEAKSFDEFNEMIHDFLSQFPESLKRDMMISFLVDSYLQLNMYHELMEQLGRIKNLPSSIYSDISMLVAEKSSLLPDSSDEARKIIAIGLMEKALIEANEEKYLLKPKFVSDIEWTNSRKANLAIMYEEYGNLLLFYKDYDKASEYFTKSKEMMGNEVTSSIYDALVMVNFESKRNTLAYNYAEESILESKTTENIEKLFPKLFKEVQGKDADLMKTLDSLKDIADNKRLVALEKKKLNSKNYLSYLKTLDGMTIDFGIIRGKVIVMTIWVSWCDPCFQPLVALDYLHNEYIDDEAVSIGVVNVWEKSADAKNEVKKFMNENNLEIPVYLDYTNSVPRKMSISGLPTTLIFDKQGKLQFKIIGFDNENSFFQDVKDRIRLLKGEE